MVIRYWRFLYISKLDFSTTEGLVRLNKATSGQRKRHGSIDATRQVNHLYIHTYIHFIGPPTFPSEYYTLCGKVNIPFSGYNNSLDHKCAGH